MNKSLSTQKLFQEESFVKPPTRKLLVKIYEHDIEVVFGYNRVTKSSKINWFDTKVYHIPQELLTTFNEKYTDHKNKKIQEIKKEMKHLLSQEEDWKDQLKIWSELRPLGQAIVWLSGTQDIDTIIETYVYDRLFYKVLSHERSHRLPDQTRIKTLTTWEKIRKFTPELKSIIDTIISDIHREFKIQIKKREKDPFRDDKYIKNEGRKKIYRNKVYKDLWLEGKEDDYILENLPHSMEEDTSRKDQTFKKDSIYKIISRDKKLKKTTNQSKKKR